jgi:hypothetical protein
MKIFLTNKKRKNQNQNIFRMNHIDEKMRIRILLLLASIVVGIVPNFVLAQCPVCTVAIGVGVGLCRYLGIDDLITGL